MKEDSDHRGNRTGASRPQVRNGSQPGNAPVYSVNELRRQSPEALRKAKRRKSFIISAIVVIVVVALIAVALTVSLKTLKRNTSSAAGNDSDTSVVKGKTKAPQGDASQMKQGIEQVTGTCSRGWMDVDVSGELAGANAASFCVSTQVAFITFQTKAAASMDGDMVRSQASNLIGQYAGGKVDEKSLRILSNDLWMAAGNAKAMKALQKQWGGKLEPIESSSAK